MDPILVGFIAYLFVILIVGSLAYRGTKNLKDFALGGQKLGPWTIAISERASGESAWLLIGLPGAALATGIFGIWTVLGVITGTILSWTFVAPRLRERTGDLDALTLPDFLSKHYGGSRSIRVLSSLIITFFFTFYVSAQFAGAGKVLNVTFGLEPIHGMLLGAMIIVIYTLMGGFLAVTYTDLVQGFIMIGTLVILPAVAYLEWRGLGESGSIVNAGDLFGQKEGFKALAGAIGGLSWGIGYLGQPHLIARFMAINSTKSIKVARRVAIAWSFPAFFGAMLIGLVGAQLLDAGVLIQDGVAVSRIADNEQLMPLMATSLLPAWFAGILISGAIAAMMSTADSQLLVTSTVLTEDIAKRFFPSQASKWQLLTVSRILTVVVSVIAFMMAIQSKDMVFEMVSYAWGGLGSSFAPALVLTLWWKKTSRIGILACLVSGTLFTIVDVTFGAVTPRLTAALLATASCMIMSLLFPDKQQA